MSALQIVQPDDSALVARIVSGDEIAADEFARKFTERFTYVARRKRVPWPDCQDVAQEALIAALVQMRRGAFRGDCKLGTWLEQIVHNKAMDFFRSRKGVTAGNFDDLETEEFDRLSEALPALKFDHDLALYVREALKMLPPQHRFILLMNRTGGFTLEEISRALEMTLGQVSNRLYAAEEMFRRWLNEGKSPGSRSMSQPLLIGGDITPERERGQSTGHSFTRMHRARDRQIAYSLLLRACLGAGEAAGRNAFARMRMLLARGAAIGSGGADAGQRSHAGAIGHAC